MPVQRFDSRQFAREERLRAFGEVALAISLGRGKGFGAQAAAQNRVARGEFGRDVPRLVDGAQDNTRLDMYVKSGDAALLTDGGLGAWSPVAEAFLENAIDRSLLGQIAAARRVGFSRQQIAQTVSATAQWVGEGRTKPASAAEFQLFALPHRKVTTISVLSIDLLDEVPAAPELVRAHLGRSVVETINAKLVSTDAETDGESPAGLAFDAQSVSSTGGTVAQITTDLRGMIDKLVDAGVSLEGAVWVASPQAGALFRLLKVADADGTLAGFPLLTSAAATGTVLLVAASYLAYASGAVSIRASQHADVTTSPTAGATTHLFAENKVALLCESYVNWRLSGPETTAGSSCVVSLTNASYA
jgi:HK97 family phage major capsid protein